MQLIDCPVAQHRDPRQGRLDLLEELELLTAHLGDVEEESRDVTAGAGQAGHPSLGRRIRLEIHSDDRNGLGRLGHDLQRLRVGGEEDVGAGGDELGTESRVFFDRVLLRGSDVDEHGLPDDVAQRAETFHEGQLTGRTAAKISHPGSLRWRLGVNVLMYRERGEAEGSDEGTSRSHPRGPTQ